MPSTHQLITPIRRRFSVALGPGFAVLTWPMAHSPQQANGSAQNRRLTWNGPAASGCPSRPGRVRDGVTEWASCDTEGRSVVVDDHATDVLTVAQILVALVDLLERVGLGDQFVELELTGVVEAEQTDDVVLRIGRTEQ